MDFMLNSEIKYRLTENLGFEPTNDQKKLFDKISDFIFDEGMSVIVLKGYAGTGKTTAIASIVKTLKQFKQKSVLLAPTGRAAKVLSSYSGKAAFTIHKKIYRQASSNDEFGKFVLNFNPNSDTVFIVDEASMIANSTSENNVFGTGSLLDDLLEYVNNGRRCKLIISGDSAQLPPVGLDLSPSLDIDFYAERGHKVSEIELKDVVRQSEKSMILSNATKIRNFIDMEDFSAVKFLVDNLEVYNLEGAELIERISDSYDKYGFNETIIINRSNKRANRYNEGIRNQILWREEAVSVGDMIMVVKNNYFWIPEGAEFEFIANGDIAEIVKIRSYKEIYGHNFAEVLLKFPDYNNIEIDTVIMLDTLRMDSPSLPFEKSREFYFKVQEDYSDIKTKKDRFKKVRENKYYNALQVKFAYAVTCHKAQGGQWKSVFIDQGFIDENNINNDYLRWIYTALTRAKEKVYLINFPEKFII